MKSSLSLAATVYGWWAKNPRALRKMSTAGRVVPIALAILSIILLQTPFTHKSFTAYIVVANAQCESFTSRLLGPWVPLQCSDRAFK